jgi:signal transduction histidine kinase
MPASFINILLIEDSLAEARLLQEFLKSAKFKQFSCVCVKRLREALERLARDRFDLILLDLSLPDSQGLSSLAPLMSRAPRIPIVVLTNTNDDNIAIEAVRQGAQDYLVKRQINPELLARSLCYAIERKQISETLREVNQALESRVRERTEELMHAQEVNQRKSEFVSMFSHDFRNPLNAVLLSAGLLQTSGDKLTKEKRLLHFQLIRSAIKDMAQLLDEVLLIGKADAGKLKCNLAEFDVVSFCEQMVREVQFSIGERHQLAFSQQGEIPNSLWDESLLRHIFSNLLINAVKYSPIDSQILFELIGRETTIDFRIQDCGIGIPADERSQLFQPFNRASNVGSISGTGLGLAIVKSCVEVHGGRILLESEVDVGTTFTVTLPIVKKEPSD